MRAIEYLSLRFVLFLVFAAITSPLTFLLVWLAQFIEARDELNGFRWVVIPIALAYILGLSWLANQAAQHMAFEDRKLGAAVRFAFYDLRLRLAFLPLVGHWFESPNEHKDRDDDDA
jgi:SNF family Na+-dependent transporter